VLLTCAFTVSAGEMTVISFTTSLNIIIYWRNNSKWFNCCL